MTECERIIQSGLLPREFLNEEIRNQFLVTTDRKKIWIIELDLLSKFDKICKKHNLTYFLAYGTLLGAVRHKGFIPWDDDVDVIMFRDDYEKLATLSKEFESPYFLQVPTKDEDYYLSWIKVRNSNTTAFSTRSGYRKFNQGIFLDIFVLDNFVYEKAQENYEIVRNLLMEIGTSMKLNKPDVEGKDITRIEEYLKRKVNPIKNYQKVNKMAQQFNDIDTKYVFQSTNTVYDLEKYVYLREDFLKTIDLKIEGLSFMAPVGYERILKTIYGNYMELPPTEKRGDWHNELFFSADIPYKEFLEKMNIHDGSPTSIKRI